jgi:hypothetical protein
VLRTFAISEHDYGQYVRTFQVKPLERDADEVQRRVVSKYHFAEEPTMFLNTNLLLMLRQTKKLEVFMYGTYPLPQKLLASRLKKIFFSQVECSDRTQWLGL